MVIHLVQMMVVEVLLVVEVIYVHLLTNEHEMVVEKWYFVKVKVNWKVMNEFVMNL